MAQTVKNLPAMWGDPGSIPGSGRSPEGNAYPLQYCLENSMDRGAWQAIVHGVEESQTWLSNFHLLTDGWMASLTWWTWVWASSRSWSWTGKTGVLQSVGLQKVRHNWMAELNLLTLMVALCWASFVSHMQCLETFLVFLTLEESKLRLKVPRELNFIWSLFEVYLQNS